jgi:putative transcriptional regulator
MLMEFIWWRTKNMEDKIFDELRQSVREMRGIRRGDLKPSSVTKLRAESLQVVRARLRLSQREFSRLLGVSIDTLQNWEQGRRAPTGPARILLKIAAMHPKIVIEAASV